jgi:hypothetical protein
MATTQGCTHKDECSSKTCSAATCTATVGASVQPAIIVPQVQWSSYQTELRSHNGTWGADPLLRALGVALTAVVRALTAASRPHAPRTAYFAAIGLDVVANDLSFDSQTWCVCNASTVCSVPALVQHLPSVSTFLRMLAAGVAAASCSISGASKLSDATNHHTCRSITLEFGCISDRACCGGQYMRCSAMSYSKGSVLVAVFCTPADERVIEPTQQADMCRVLVQALASTPCVAARQPQSTAWVLSRLKRNKQQVVEERLEQLRQDECRKCTLPQQHMFVGC